MAELQAELDSAGGPLPADALLCRARAHATKRSAAPTRRAPPGAGSLDEHADSPWAGEARQQRSARTRRPSDRCRSCVIAYRILGDLRAGRPLGEQDLEALARGAADGSWSDAQLGAFLMGAAIRGLDAGRDARAHRSPCSTRGERWELAQSISRLLADKHSTGGVGDKTSLVLAPLLARLRRAGRDAHRPRPRPHRRHRRQARVDSGAAPGPRPRRAPCGCSREFGMALGIATAADRAGRPPALRPARPHRDGRLAAADRRQHPVEEARHRAPRRSSSTSRAATAPSCRSRPRRATLAEQLVEIANGLGHEGLGPAHRHEPAARRLGRTRGRGARGARLPRRRRAGRDG